MTAFSPPLGYREMKGPGTFPEHIGPLYFKRDGEHYSYAFNALPHHANANGIIHGGMLVTFIDEIMGTQVWRAIGRKPCATISLNCDFVAAVKPGDWVEARTNVVRRGVSVIFMRGELVVGNKTVLTADGIWKVIGR